MLNLMAKNNVSQGFFKDLPKHRQLPLLWVAHQNLIRPWC